LAQDFDATLAGRLGRRYTQQRLRLENRKDAGSPWPDAEVSRLVTWHPSARLIRTTLRLTGLYRRGLANAAKVELRQNDIVLARLPRAFDGLRILHISDMHIELNPGAMQSLFALLGSIEYDLCVMTGDYRGKLRGEFQSALDGLTPIRSVLRDPIYGVLGNHDPIGMVPGLEALGIRMLVNECATLSRGAERMHLAGIDDAHYFGLGNIEKAAASIPEGAFSILLSHTPEIYRQAEAADFDLLLAGHTHGGQICLPGSIPITVCASLPRRMASGAWRYGNLTGYTSTGVGSSLVPVRFNCPPTITLHRLCRRDDPAPV
jgi:uncharacterized protein